MEERTESDTTNPLRDERTGAWDRLIESIGPATLLVAIDSRIGERIRVEVTAEDVLQDVLVRVWQSRATLVWDGVPAFRRYVLRVAENILRDIADALATEKRGGGKRPVELPSLSGASSSLYAGPAPQTTPSRAASDRERSERMKAALESLPSDVREIVRLRLFDDLTMEEVAARVGLGVSNAQHRFRKGAESYFVKLRALEALSTHAPRREVRENEDHRSGV